MQDPVTRVTAEFMADYDHLNPSGHRHPRCKLNRLANIGLDCRDEVSPDLDLNLLTDRGYEFVFETSDDGWLIGGGDDAKLGRRDTAHAEIWRFGPDNLDDGGLPFDLVERTMRGIRFAPIRVKPLRVNLTPSSELELLLEHNPASVIGQLLDIYSSVLACPCGDYGNPFHITLVRGVKFRSDATQKAYFDKVAAVVADWRVSYPDGVMFNDGGVDLFAHRERILAHVSPSLDQGVVADVDDLRRMRDSG
ncbi:MAG: hypothetical protein AAGH83_02205 [Pseudomonadota bacterium]